MVNKVKANLSVDIIEANVLTRIPVKTLIRFKAVCKSWYSLLSDPFFIKSYNQSQKNKKSNLLLIDYNHENNVAVADSCLQEQSWLSSFNDTANLSYKYVNVVGCCDGIVCVSAIPLIQTSFPSKHNLCLWNPALRINKIIATYDQTRWSDQCVGFGHHDQTNDYQVIVFSNIDFFMLEHVDIYSLNSDSWKKIELGANQLLIDHCPVKQFGVHISSRLGGSYCWLAREHHYRSWNEDSLISFHMEDGAFKKSTLPYDAFGYSCKNFPYDAIDYSRRKNRTLFVYKDSLAMLHTCDSNASNPSSSRICYIWVMKEYGDPKSWTKLCRFDSQRPYVSFVGVVETDQILLICGDIRRDIRIPINKVVNVLDMDKSQMKLTSYTKEITKARWVVSYTESLALLNGVGSRNSSSN